MGMRGNYATRINYILHVIKFAISKLCYSETKQSVEDKMVEEIFEMSLLDESNFQLRNITSNMPHQPSANLCMVQQMPSLNSNLQMGIANSALQNHAMINNTPNLPNPAGQGNIQNIGMQNSVLNSSLGLPIGGPNNGMVLPIPDVLPQGMPNTPLNPAMNVALQQHPNVMGNFQQTANLPVIPTPNVANSSLFIGQNNGLVSF